MTLSVYEYHVRHFLLDNVRPDRKKTVVEIMRTNQNAFFSERIGTRYSPLKNVITSEENVFNDFRHSI